MFVGALREDHDIELVGIDLARAVSTGAHTRPVQRFIGTNHQPAWSPDGTSMAYMSRRGVDAIVVVQSLATGTVRELVPDPPLGNSPEFRGLTWTPDGRSLVVFGSDLTGREGIYRIDAASGAASPLIVPMAAGERPKFGGFSWTADGDRLYVGRMNGEIAEYDRATAGVRTLPQSRTSGSGRVESGSVTGNVSLSPDGRTIAGVQQLSASAGQAVVLIPTGQGEVRELLRVAPPERVDLDNPIWTPDGRAIVLRKRTDSGPSDLWMFPIDGRPARRMEVDVSRAWPGYKGSLRLSPDGRWLAYVNGQRSQEVCVFEGLEAAIASAE